MVILGASTLILVFQETKIITSENAVYWYLLDIVIFLLAGGVALWGFYPSFRKREDKNPSTEIGQDKTTKAYDKILEILPKLKTRLNELAVITNIGRYNPFQFGKIYYMITNEYQMGDPDKLPRVEYYLEFSSYMNKEGIISADIWKADKTWTQLTQELECQLFYLPDIALKRLIRKYISFITGQYYEQVFLNSQASSDLSLMIEKKRELAFDKINGDIIQRIGQLNRPYPNLW